MKKLTKTNPHLVSLIKELKEHSAKQKTEFWKSIALKLEKSTRNQKSVNLKIIEKYSLNKEIILVPGKVLGEGELTKDLTIVALNFSESAKDKIKNRLTIKELLHKNPTGKGVRIIG